MHGWVRFGAAGTSRQCMTRNGSSWKVGQERFGPSSCGWARLGLAGQVGSGQVGMDGFGMAGAVG